MVMSKLRFFILSGTALLLALALVPATARAEDTGCPVGKSGHQITRSPSGRCDVDETPPSPQTQRVTAAKKAAAEAYAAYKDGTASQQQFDAALNRLEAVAGVPPKNTTKGSGIFAYGYVGVSSKAQINYYYCGPATAQDILSYLGPTTSNKYDTVTGAYDAFNGDDTHDQTNLANSFWLATDMYGGTNWGDAYMPFTLNGWHGGSWYVGANSYNLSSSAAWSDVDFDTNYGHPVAENIYYGESTYYPDGFTPRLEGYQHWDVIYQTFSASGAQWASVAQPWPYPGAGTRTPYQTWSWSNVWKAIAANYGIVW
ncbi:MAG: hypothetical protein ABIQ47_05595 [Tepidiformaceae bacterium]